MNSILIRVKEKMKNLSSFSILFIFLLTTIIAGSFMKVSSFNLSKNDSSSELLYDLSKRHINILSRQVARGIYDMARESTSNQSLEQIDELMFFLWNDTAINNLIRTAYFEFFDKLDFNGDIYILNREGIVISHTDRGDSRRNQDLFREELFKEIQTADVIEYGDEGSASDSRWSNMIIKNGYLNYNVEGIDYVAAYTKTSGTGWIIIVELEEEDITLSDYDRARSLIDDFSMGQINIVSRQVGAGIYDIVRELTMTHRLDQINEAKLINLNQASINDLIGRTQFEIFEQLGFNGDIYMLNREGEVIAHSDSNKVNHNFSEKEFFKEIKGADKIEYDEKSSASFNDIGRYIIVKNGYLNYELEGIDQVASYTQIKGLDWIIIAEVEEESIISSEL